MLKPRRRTEDLVVVEQAEETLVYDRPRRRAHCLNVTAAQIFQLCDGERTVPEIAATLQERLGTTSAEPVVWMALAQLNKAELMQNDESSRPPVPKIPRRRALIQMGIAAAALPVVFSIMAPNILSAASTISTVACTLLLPPCPGVPCTGLGSGHCITVTVLFVQKCLCSGL